MSLDLALTQDTHDIDLSPSGDASWIEAAERVQQQIKVTLLAFLGEWFLDITFGVPYLEAIMVKGPDRAQIEAILRASIADVPGVSSVRRLSIEIDRPQRQLAVNFEAATDFGIVARHILMGR